MRKEIEISGWYFGGGFRGIVDDHDIHHDGSRGPHVLENLTE